MCVISYMYIYIYTDANTCAFSIALTSTAAHVRSRGIEYAVMQATIARAKAAKPLEIAALERTWNACAEGGSTQGKGPPPHLLPSSGLHFRKKGLATILMRHLERFVQGHRHEAKPR